MVVLGDDGSGELEALIFSNPEHAHALLDLPTNLCIESVVQLFKGASSHWINEAALAPGKFGWGQPSLLHPSNFTFPTECSW